MSKQATQESNQAIQQLAEPPAQQTAKMPFGVEISRNLSGWLKSEGVTLAISTYQAGRVLFFGTKETSGEFSLFNRFYARAMGMHVASTDTIWLATLFQLWKLENVLKPNERYQKDFERLYVPRVAYTTGDIDIHDIGTDSEGFPVFVSTAYSCLARPSTTRSFEPIWKPKFITKLAAEDRCHLNGMAMRDGRPAFVSAVATTDCHNSWREHRSEGGVLIDVASHEIVCSGLSMPHSPRWHEGKLYVLNSGCGEFGTVDLATGKFEKICFCAGYARGLAFTGDYAVIGLSNCRENRSFSGLELDNALKNAKVSPRCGIIVVNLKTGDCVHHATITGEIRELYDVGIIPNARSGASIGFQNNEIKQLITPGIMAKE